MKNLNKLNVFTSTQKWDNTHANSSKQDIITIFRKESLKMSFEEVLHFNKALVFLQDIAFENISTSIELELDW